MTDMEERVLEKEEGKDIKTMKEALDEGAVKEASFEEIPREKEKDTLTRMKESVEEAMKNSDAASAPSMDDFKEELNRSFKKLQPGDIVRGSVIGVSDTEVTIDLGSYSEGIVKLEELSDDPRFSIKADIKVGDVVSATMIREDREGNILLSMKQARDVLAWDELMEMKNERTIARVKVASAVKAGVTTFIKGTRAFIPASQLALEYVENTEEYVNRELEVIVIDVSEDDKKVVLSAKEVLRDRAAADKTSRISKLQIGLVTTGTVEKLATFGAFVNIGEGLSGLVHISQICDKRIKSPKEVLSEGDQVNVKIMDVKDGKISLSIKAATEKEEVLLDAVDEAETGYSDGEETGTGLGALLSKLNLK